MGSLSTSEIMTKSLGLEKYQMTRSNEMRVGDIMRQLGYDRQRRRVFNKRVYVWVKNKEANILPMSKPELVETVEGGEH